eukprot:scaffold89988_cov47-Cyclotella_meneghiniana.AAC.2
MSTLLLLMPPNISNHEYEHFGRIIPSHPTALLFQEVDVIKHSGGSYDCINNLNAQPSAFPASSAYLMGFRQSKPTVQSLIPLLDYSFEASAPYLSYPV